MNAKKAIVTVLAIVAIALVAVRLTKVSSPLTGARSGTASSYANAPRTLPADAVLAIAPGSAATAARRPVSVLSPVMNEYAHAKSYKSLYDRLRPASSRTPEEAWVLARILKQCSLQAGEAHTEIKLDAAVARFSDALSPRDPSRDRRIAAFRATLQGHCEGLGNLQATPEMIHDLLATAAAAGEPKALAQLVEDDLWAQLRRNANPDAQGYVLAAIGNAQVGDLKRAAESGDPYALVTAAQVLAFPLANLSLQSASDGRPIEAETFVAAAELLACESGYPCGPDSYRVEAGCAYQGRCEAQSLREYMFFYALAPDASQRLAEYQAALSRAVRDHDWSALAFHPGPGPGLAIIAKP